MNEDILDSVLDFEKECYDSGFEEGAEAGKKQGHLEGRELGIQTGFQRYRSLGIMQGRISIWKAQKDDKLQSQLKQVEQYSQCPSFENDPKVADKISLNIKMVKTKLRLLAANTQSPPVELHDDKLVFQKNDASIEDL
ncbi:hypothetical protein B9G98_04177 [Wickerhamiella sorbophila]|uniref:Essential protein Yae1 N-terminal domain-containing protein n=1 Tax=Wickerhamiella sorbophila TaxID=45607 RepID=A0A2T0FNK1_9ASCO|nr:hypothetical protein B9G98_04177 [Wickerhamiella sorbophila]PRT56557.1 hypothetical protein B9G98_04177 [Wickerhamiella sorbophila]